MNKIKETISQLEALKEHCKAMRDIDECKDYSSYIAALDTAIKVLRKMLTNEVESVEYGK